MFPRSNLGEKVLLFQSGAMTFLSNNKFDFNKLIKEGIPYQQLSQKEKILYQCKSKVSKEVKYDVYFTNLSEESK
jgi:hypothetical protein